MKGRVWGPWEELGEGHVGNEVGEPLRGLWGRVRLGGAVRRACLCEGCGGGCAVRRLLFV